MTTFATCIYLWLGLVGGFERPTPDQFGRITFAIFRATTWILLLLAAYMFMGRGAKFIYIDF